MTELAQKKRLGIDARLISQTGVGTYIRNLLAHLPTSFTQTVDVVCFVRSEDVDMFKAHFPAFSYVIANERWHSIAEQTFFLNVLYKARLDAMHFTYFSFPILYQKPYISTIHDLTPLLHKTGKATQLPSLLYDVKHRVLQLVLQQSVAHARYIITPSNTVKQEILHAFSHANEKRIVPIYEGVNTVLLQTPPRDRLAGRLKEPFFLHVGNFYPHKNLKRLIEAYVASGVEWNLVLVGPDDVFARGLRTFVNETYQSHASRIIWLHSLDNADLAYCYKHAKALVHPALAEGFGLTIAEAIAFETPVIASNIAVFQELFSEAFVPFDPTSTTDMANVLAHFAANPQNRGKKTSLPFSFEAMAAETVCLYEEVLQG